MEDTTTHSPNPAFKAEVALAAIKGNGSLSELGEKFSVHPNEIKDWCSHLEKNAALVFGGDVIDVPRALPVDPYGPRYNGLTLNKRVQIALEASEHYGRRVGAIVMHVVATEKGTAPIEKTLLEDLTNHMQERLRSSDYAGLSRDGTVVLYVSLLNSLNDLYSIARRMHHAAVQFLDNGGHPQFALEKPGVAMYPADGTSAEELYRAAAGRTANA